jgi:ubiquinone/menaquinone biosynthesis C-methylase UbiE
MHNSIKANVERQFSQVAASYRTSAVHAAGEDLAQLVAAAGLTGAERVLDAGSGAGHTALAVALHAAQVVSVDLSAAMLAQGQRLAQERGLDNVTFGVGDVEALEFPDASFDVVVSRYSAHHWPHPARAIAQFRRLLRPGGRFVLSDIVSREDPTFDTHLQAIELLRDPSHVRDHTVSEWQALLAAQGFQAEVIYTWALRLQFDDWVQRMATPPDAVAMLRTLLDHAPAEVRAALAVEPDHSFTIPGALVRAWRG